MIARLCTAALLVFSLAGCLSVPSVPKPMPRSDSAPRVGASTLQQLAKSMPLYPPIEGLDESLWKKPCVTCHKWNRKRLCDQGTFYVKSAKNVLRHQHPFGGQYKIALMRWSKSGCK